MVNAPGINARADVGIEILVRMARDGEIDPWDVDIIDVTDRYLQAIAGIKVTDLVASAKLIFYASVLLHLKAQVLARGTADLSILDTEEQLPEEPLELDEDEEVTRGGYVRPVVGPREPLPLQPRNRLPRRRGVTLFDLIKALRSYEDRLNTASEFDLDDGLGDLDIAEACLDSGHREDPEAEREAVEDALGLPGDPGTIFDFKMLCENLIPLGFTRASIYLSLLFIASYGRVELEQEEFYTAPLSVVVVEPPPADETEVVGVVGGDPAEAEDGLVEAGAE